MRPVASASTTSSPSATAADQAVGADPPQRIVLLPERRRLSGAPSLRLARALGRASRREGAAGEQAQLQRSFTIEPDGWPLAALQRQAEAHDAGPHAWLRADPVHLRAEMAGARLLAWGNLGLEAGEADAFITALAPLLAEEGIDIGRTAPEHWYLRLPEGLVPPDAAVPADALGDDLLPHLPAGNAGRSWRRLQSELQVLLHQHPLNASRIMRGQLALNSVWFWGGGCLPARVSSPAAELHSDEPMLVALALAAGLTRSVSAESGVAGLLDLRRLRDWSAVEAVPGGVVAPRHGGVALRLDFSDGEVLDLQPPPRWAFWRG